MNKYNKRNKYSLGGLKTPRRGEHSGSLTPFAPNLYNINGSSHANGGVNIDKGNLKVEAEGGEVVWDKNDGYAIFSNQPILGGQSPANLVRRGANPNEVFKAQQISNMINHRGDFKNMKYGGDKPKRPKWKIASQKGVIGARPRLVPYDYKEEDLNSFSPLGSGIFNGSGSGGRFKVNHVNLSGYSNFNEAFDEAVKRNAETFTFANKEYNTKKETNPIREINNRFVGNNRTEKSLENIPDSIYPKERGYLKHELNNYPLVIDTYNPNKETKMKHGGRIRTLWEDMLEANRPIYNPTLSLPFTGRGQIGSRVIGGSIKGMTPNSVLVYKGRDKKGTYYNAGQLHPITLEAINLSTTKGRDKWQKIQGQKGGDAVRKALDRATPYVGALQAGLMGGPVALGAATAANAAMDSDLPMGIKIPIVVGSSFLGGKGMPRGARGFRRLNNIRGLNANPGFLSRNMNIVPPINKGLATRNILNRRAPYMTPYEGFRRKMPFARFIDNDGQLSFNFGETKLPSKTPFGVKNALQNTRITPAEYNYSNIVNNYINRRERIGRMMEPDEIGTPTKYRRVKGNKEIIREPLTAEEQTANYFKNHPTEFHPIYNPEPLSVNSITKWEPNINEIVNFGNDLNNLVNTFNSNLVNTFNPKLIKPLKDISTGKYYEVNYKKPIKFIGGKNELGEPTLLKDRFGREVNGIEYYFPNNIKNTNIDITPSKSTKIIKLNGETVKPTKTPWLTRTRDAYLRKPWTPFNYRNSPNASNNLFPKILRNAGRLGRDAAYSVAANYLGDAMENSDNLPVRILGKPFGILGLPYKFGKNLFNDNTIQNTNRGYDYDELDDYNFKYGGRIKAKCGSRVKAANGFPPTDYNEFKNLSIDDVVDMVNEENNAPGNIKYEGKIKPMNIILPDEETKKELSSTDTFRTLTPRIGKFTDNDINTLGNIAGSIISRIYDDKHISKMKYPKYSVPYVAYKRPTRVNNNADIAILNNTYNTSANNAYKNTASSRVLRNTLNDISESIGLSKIKSFQDKYNTERGLLSADISNRESIVNKNIDKFNVDRQNIIDFMNKKNEMRWQSRTNLINNIREISKDYISKKEDNKKFKKDLMISLLANAVSNGGEPTFFNAVDTLGSKYGFRLSDLIR